MGTRLEKSRMTKRPMARAEVYEATQAFNYDIGQQGAPGKVPRTDLKGYPTNFGVPGPVLVDVNFVEDPGDFGGQNVMQEGDDPGNFTVPQVRAFCLSIWPDRNAPAPTVDVENEVQRITDDERAGQNRGGIVNWTTDYPGIA